jgi:hypothetical protein
MARELSATLEEAQKWGIITYPYLIAKIRRKWGGVIRYDFEQLYDGGGLAEEKIIGMGTVSEDGVSGTQRFYLDRFQAEKSGYINQIRVDADAPMNINVGIYADESGEPGARLSVNNGWTAIPMGWSAVTIPSVYLTEGTYYWLAYTGYTNRLRTHTQTADVRYKAVSGSNWQLPDPAGSGFTTVTTSNRLIASWQSGAAAEYDGPHCAVVPSDGSLIRLRVTEGGDNLKLYYQRITDPDEYSEFWEWNYLSIYNVLAVASCAIKAPFYDFGGDSICAALFKFNNNPNDSKGNNNLTAVNSPTYDSGDKKEGTHCIDFERSSTQYCAIADGDLDVGFPGKSGTPEQSFSICGWFKLEAVDVYQGLVCKYITSSPKRSYGITVNASGYVSFLIGYNNGANASSITFDTPLSAGIWYHIKATYNATNNQMRLRIWDDNAGALLDAVKEGTAAGDMSPTDAPLEVGAYNDGTNTMDGKTDEVVIFRDVLTDDEHDLIIAGLNGRKVAQAYINADRELYLRESTDDGASWGSWGLITYTATTSIWGFSAAYKPNGDLGLFWIDQQTIVRDIRVDGAWGGQVNYNPFSQNLSGIAVIYNEDWELVVTGKDADEQWSVWSVVLGDGNRVVAGTWSDFEVIIARETTEPYEYNSPFLVRTDTTRLFFVESVTIDEQTDHIFYSQMPPTAYHDEGLWLEPVPMEPESIHGLAINEEGAHAWLTNANSVYRAISTDEELDITNKLLIVDANQSPDIQRGTLKISVDNSAGVYNSFDRIGDEITLGIGYKTGAGNEYSLMSSFWITHYELRSPEYKFWYAIFAPGILGTLYIEAQGAWDFLRRYRTRRPHSWAEGEKSVLELLKYFFARAGLNFAVLSSSDAVNNFKPEFESTRSTKYSTIIKNLLKMIPDQVFQREATIYLRNPTEAESVDWIYHNLLGTANLVYRGKYGTSAQDPNRAEVWTDTEMKAEADWEQIKKVRDRLSRITTPTYPDLTRATERVEAELRRAEVLTSEQGWLFAPVNCGLEPWDKLQITDQVAGVATIIRRAIRVKLHWDAKNWDYSQQVILGAD